MKKWQYSLSLLALSLMVAAACAPAAAPPPAPAPAPAAPAPAPQVSPEDAAWAKVVAEAKKEGKLTLYTFGLYGDIGKAVAKGFEDRYGIKIEFVTGIGTVLIQRIRGEQAAGRYIADTLDTAGSLVFLAKQEGLTQSFGPLPSLRESGAWNIRPEADPEGHVLGVRPAIFSPYINTNLVKTAEIPKSYKDLLAPQWKKRMVIDSPVTSPAVIWIYLAMLKAGALDESYWRQLARQDLLVAPTIRDVISKVVQGESHLAVLHADSNMAPFVQRGAPIKTIDVEEGVVVVSQSLGLGMVKGAPHPNAARLLANWLLSQEGHNTFSQAVGGFFPLRKDVPDIRPSAVKASQHKVTYVDIPMQLEATRLQREGTLARVLGVER